MKNTRPHFLTATACLSTIFGISAGCAGAMRNTSERKAPEDKVTEDVILPISSEECVAQLLDSKPLSPESLPVLKGIVNDSRTPNARYLKALETRAKALSPSGTAPIILLDVEKIKQWQALKSKPLAQAVGDYMEARTGESPDKNAICAMATGIGAKYANLSALSSFAINPHPTTNTPCYVLPASLDMNPFEYYRDITEKFYTSVGEKSPMQGKIFATSPSKDMLRDYFNVHEINHCFDNTYIYRLATRIDTGMISPPEFGSDKNHMETFADVGAAMRMTCDTGSTQFITSWMLPQRAFDEYPATPLIAQRCQDDFCRYSSIAYHIAPALHDVTQRIDAMGIKDFCRQTPDEMAKIGYEVTDKNALSPDDASPYVMSYRIGKDLTEEVGAFRAHAKKLASNFMKPQ